MNQYVALVRLAPIQRSRQKRAAPARASRLTENDLQALFSRNIMGILNLDPRS
jgi:hypothetical protein